MGAPDADLERTDLAWDRSVLAIGAVGLLLLKQLLPHVHAHLALGILLLSLAALYAAAAYWYRWDRRHRRWVSRSALRAVSVATVGVGVALLALEFVPH
jgi:uncharacterized membrane protein YidH (DUF202 family)